MKLLNRDGESILRKYRNFPNSPKWENLTHHTSLSSSNSTEEASLPNLHQFAKPHFSTSSLSLHIRLQRTFLKKGSCFLTSQSSISLPLHPFPSYIYYILSKNLLPRTYSRTATATSVPPAPRRLLLLGCV